MFTILAAVARRVTAASIIIVHGSLLVVSWEYKPVSTSDFDRRVDGSIAISMEDGSTFYQVFTDYNTNKAYTVTKFGDCFKSTPRQEMTDFCTQGLSRLSDLEFLESGSLGVTMEYDAWRYKLGGIDTSIYLARDGCIPLLQNVKNDLYNATLMFTDVTTTFDSDNQILEIPAACL